MVAFTLEVEDGSSISLQGQIIVKYRGILTHLQMDIKVIPFFLTSKLVWFLV